MYDMTIQLGMGKKQCLYEQIYEHIRQEIIGGKLLAGEKLPSTRLLAQHLQVARSTVDTAYEQLLSEGYIESSPCKGFFVCELDELFFLEKGQKKPDAEEGTSVADLRGENPVRIDFSPTAIDKSLFPYSVWKKISREAFGTQDLFSMGSPQGDEELRRTISRYLHSSRGVNCTPEQIIVGAGNDYLLLLLEKILGSHLTIAMENPTYKRAYRIFRSCGYDVKAIPMDESGMKIKELEKEEASVAYIMPSHQYPTGTVMPIGRRMELLHWADEKDGRYLIEDDYDSEFRYKGKPIPSLQASDRHGKVIYIGTFSKSIAPALRLSFMVLPFSLLDFYKKNLYFYSSTVSRIDQWILNEFISKGHFERHLNKMRKIYRSRHEVMLSCLAPFKGRFRITGENAGLHLLLTVKGKKDGMTEEKLIEKARQKGIRVYGLSDSFIRESDGEERQEGEMQEREVQEKESHRGNETNAAATVLLGFGGLSEEQMKEGLEALYAAWIQEKE